MAGGPTISKQNPDSLPILADSRAGATCAEQMDALASRGNGLIYREFLRFCTDTELADKYAAYHARLAQHKLSGELGEWIPPIVYDNALRGMLAAFQMDAAEQGYALSWDTPGIWSRDSRSPLGASSETHRRELPVWKDGQQIGVLFVTSIHGINEFGIFEPPVLSVKKSAQKLVPAVTGATQLSLFEGQLTEFLRNYYNFFSNEKQIGPYAKLFETLKKAGLYSYAEREFIPNPAYDFLARMVCARFRGYLAYQGFAPHVDTPGEWKSSTESTEKDPANAAAVIELRSFTTTVSYAGQFAGKFVITFPHRHERFEFAGAPRFQIVDCPLVA